MTVEVRERLMWAVLRAGYHCAEGFGIVDICETCDIARMWAVGHGDRVIPVMVRQATRAEVRQKNRDAAGVATRPSLS